MKVVFLSMGLHRIIRIKLLLISEIETAKLTRKLREKGKQNLAYTNNLLKIFIE